jgi:beta-fructofuranosidase
MWESADTREWEYCGEVFSRPAGGELDTGPVWECPQLVQVDGVWVLLLSVQLPGSPDPLCPYVVWFTGTFDGRRFSPEASGLFDEGDVVYASAVSEADDGRALVWSWIQEPIGLRGREGLGWAGAMALPRELEVRDRVLLSRPARETEALWDAPIVDRERMGLHPGERLRVAEAMPAYRLRLAWREGGVRVVLGQDLSGRPLIVDATGDDAIAVSLGDDVLGIISGTPSARSLDALVDVGVIELYLGGRALTLRVDGELSGPGEVAVHAGDGGATLDRLELRTLQQHRS